MPLRNYRLVFLVVVFFANRYKELAEKLVELLKTQFVCFSRVAFKKQEILGTEEHRVRL